MNTVVLKSSPNLHGSSNLPADHFIRGTAEAGHTVTDTDAARADVHPCTGCVRCGYEGPCVQRGGMEGIKGVALSSDMIVLVTPLYYYGMTAQLKTADRPLLRLQQLPDRAAAEVRPHRGGVEQRRLDLCGHGGPRKDPGRGIFTFRIREWFWAMDAARWR